MKKVISVLFVCLFILSGCSNSSEEQEYSSDYEQDIENSDDEYDFLLGNEDEEEMVDEIFVDNSEISLKYTGFEIRDDIDDNEQPIKRIVVYLDFTNKMNSPMSSSNSINSIAYQGGIELKGWGGRFGDAYFFTEFFKGNSSFFSIFLYVVPYSNAKLTSHIAPPFLL